LSTRRRRRRRRRIKNKDWEKGRRIVGVEFWGAGGAELIVDSRILLRGLEIFV
jgi:hypothetical protein